MLACAAALHLGMQLSTRSQLTLSYLASTCMGYQRRASPLEAGRTASLQCMRSETCSAWTLCRASPATGHQLPKLGYCRAGAAATHLAPSNPETRHTMQVGRVSLLTNIAAQVRFYTSEKA